jgi:hypothetical protein
MLGFNIGWQEVGIVILFVLGIIVIPLPSRWLKRRAREPMRWTAQFSALPVERIHDVAEAFFCSYAMGEYTLEAKERFRLVFHRGQPPAQDDQAVVLSLRGADGGPDDVFVVLRVLLQPRPDSLLITMKHEVTPRRTLSGRARKKLTARLHREVDDFDAYLSEHFGDVDTLNAPRPVRRINAWRRDG